MPSNEEILEITNRKALLNNNNQIKIYQFESDYLNKYIYILNT